MDDQTKIQLSALELDLLNNADFILTKNLIVKKASGLLEQVERQIFAYAASQDSLFPAGVIKISPKISKGENYLGLPWLMLDYPRYFDKENIFAFRTMFWWGHFFSSTLQLAGSFKGQYQQQILAHYPSIRAGNFSVCVHEDQWHHHFDVHNYKPVKEIEAPGFSIIISGRPFLKLAKTIPFSRWSEAVELLSQNFVEMTRWLR